MIRKRNSLSVISCSNQLEQISLHTSVAIVLTVKWYQLFLSKTNTGWNDKIVSLEKTT